MVVLVVHVDRIALRECKRNAPIAAHPHGPSAFALAGERMQEQTGEFHICRIDRNLQPTQDHSEPLFVLRLDPSFRALAKEALEASMPEAAYHLRIVTHNAPGYKTPDVRPQDQAAPWDCDGQAQVACALDRTEHAAPVPILEGCARTHR